VIVVVSPTTMMEPEAALNTPGAKPVAGERSRDDEAQPVPSPGPALPLNPGSAADAGGATDGGDGGGSVVIPTADASSVRREVPDGVSFIDSFASSCTFTSTESSPSTHGKPAPPLLSAMPPASSPVSPGLAVAALSSAAAAGSSSTSSTTATTAAATTTTTNNNSAVATPPKPLTRGRSDLKANNPDGAVAIRERRMYLEHLRDRVGESKPGTTWRDEFAALVAEAPGVPQVSQPASHSAAHLTSVALVAHHAVTLAVTHVLSSPASFLTK
jgi:hypothetical protein